MRSGLAEFWDERYLAEGAVWGETPSPTAAIAVRYLRRGMRVLDVGFGYGRDLPCLVRLGCDVVGVDPSQEGCRQAALRLGERGLRAERLVAARFEDIAPSLGQFDLVMSHRMVHLLETDASVAGFARAIAQVVRPGGALVIGARNPRDLDPRDVIRIDEGLYEKRSRPGHRIRYWDEQMFSAAFSRAFRLEVTFEAIEAECELNPTPCFTSIVKGVRRCEPCAPAIAHSA